MARNVSKIVTQYKQWVVVRSDLDMSPGKITAQACHASVIASRRQSDDNVNAWIKEGSWKSILRINSEAEMFELMGRLNYVAPGQAHIYQEGKSNEVKEGSFTAMAIGPVDMHNHVGPKVQEILRNIKEYGRKEQR